LSRRSLTKAEPIPRSAIPKRLTPKQVAEPTSSIRVVGLGRIEPDYQSTCQPAFDHQQPAPIRPCLRSLPSQDFGLWTLDSHKLSKNCSHFTTPAGARHRNQSPSRKSLSQLHNLHGSGERTRPVPSRGSTAVFHALAENSGRTRKFQTFLPIHPQ
jgi:hypothetical protein